MASKRARKKVTDRIEDLSNTADDCLRLVRALRPRTARVRKLIKILSSVEEETQDLENDSYAYYRDGK